MTKNVFKIGAVVLLICMLGAVGVSSAAAHAHGEETNAEFEVLPADFIWKNTQDGKFNWTYVDAGNPVVFINATTGSATHQYLSAYNVTLGGDLTVYKVAANPYGILATGFTKIIAKDLNVSSTLTEGHAKQIDADAEKLFNVTLNKAFTDSGADYDGVKKSIYVLATSELGLINQENPDDVILDGGFLKDTSAGKSEDFDLYIRKEQPDVSLFVFGNYTDPSVGDQEYVDENPKTVYIYKEHGNISIGTDSVKIRDKYDNTQWHTEAGTKFNVGDGELVTVKINENTLNFSDAGARLENPSEGFLFVKVNPNLNDKAGNNNVELESKIKVNVTNWNRTMSSNAISATPSNGIDEKGWNFMNPLGVNYTVGAGRMDLTSGATGGWETNVTIDILTNESGVEFPAWTPKVSYAKANGNPITADEFQINGADAGTQLPAIDGTVKFIVTKNTINDGDSTKDVIITLGGFKKGDADLDDYVDIVDSSIVGITIAQDPIKKMIKTNMDNFKYADCNSQEGDGEITVADVWAINKFLVGDEPWQVTP